MADETITLTEDSPLSADVSVDAVITFTEDSPHAESASVLASHIFKPTPGAGLRVPLGLLEDPKFEDPNREIKAWFDGTDSNVMPAGYTYSDESPRVGVYSLKIDSTVDDVKLYNRSLVPVMEGRGLLFMAWAKALDSVSGVLQVGVEWQDENQVSLGDDSYKQSVLNAGPAAYSLFAGVATAPAGAYYARFFILKVIASSTWYVDDCDLIELTTLATSNLLMADGLIRFGGFTNAFPAIRRNGTRLEVVTADEDDPSFKGLTAHDLIAGTVGPNSSQQHALPAEASDTLATRAWVNSQLGAVTGPASATSGNLPSFNGTSGKTIQDSGVAALAIVTLADAQTLTNKTLTSPVVNSPTGIVKGDVGLGNADNTSDANKPVSTAQQAALDLKAALSHTHAASDITSGSLAQARQSLTAAGAYLIAPWDQYPASNVSCPAASNNSVSVVAFIPKATLTVLSVHFDVQAASAGGLCSVGIYSADGNTKLIDSGTKSTTSTGAQSTTLGASVTLYANTMYWLAYTHDNTTSAVRGIAAALAGVTNVLNAGTVQVGTAANSATAGALPGTLGSISASSRPIPFVKLQG